MSKYLTLGIAILASLVLLATASFGQGQQAPKSSVLTKPKSTPGKVLRPHLVKVKINLGTSVAQDATVTLDIISIPLQPNATQADIEASKPTHYRWSWYQGEYHRDCIGSNQSKRSEWIPMQKNVKPFATLKGCKMNVRSFNRHLKKGVCGVVNIVVQVKNSAGESNEKIASSPPIVTESEFFLYGFHLLKAWHGKVSGSLGSVCKLSSGFKRYVQGAEELSALDNTFLDVHHKEKFGSEDAVFLSTGATPLNGSKCEYELYTNKSLPEKFSVVEFNTLCSATRKQWLKPGAYGCTMLRIPAPGTRDLTTRVRVWTDALKDQGTWAWFENEYVIVKGDCRGVTISSWPDMQ